MSLRLDGRKLASELEKRLQSEISSHRGSAGRPPGLAVIRIGDDIASGVYVAYKEKACARIGVSSFGVHMPAKTSTAEVISKINALNANEEVDGILLQLPLPEGIEANPLLIAVVYATKRASQLPPLWRCLTFLRIVYSLFSLIRD